MPCLRCLWTVTALAAGANAKMLRFVGKEESALQAVHEWGTYISCQGSDGSVLAGVHHEEESLPAFVHARGDGVNADDSTNSNGLDWTPVAGTASQVTQKMETPVIYFYSDSTEDFTASVDVAFPEGVTTHLYPASTSNLPEIGTVTETAGGRTLWDVTVKAAGVSIPIPPVEEDNIWAPSRRVDANFVAGQDTEADRLIFYRGVGNFDLDLHASSDIDSATLTVSNTDDTQDIAAAFALETDGYSRGRVVSLGSVAAGGSASTGLSEDARSLAGDWMPFAEYQVRASVLLEEALRNAGLYALEARAMVDTWTRSYFQTSGTRVLYVTPRPWVDVVLPISVSPTPEELERVFVGRVEILLAGEEQALLQAAQRGASFSALEPQMGRFAEPWLRRIATLASNAGSSDVAARFLTRADDLA